MGKVLMMRKGEVHSAPITFPQEPTAYTELVGTYTSSTTFTAPESGYYEIQLFGASGNGGTAACSNDGSSSQYPVVAYSGAGGGGGGVSASRVKLNAGDTVVLTLGTGVCSAVINSTQGSYEDMKVTAGNAGGEAKYAGHFSKSGSSWSSATGAPPSGTVGFTHTGSTTGTGYYFYAGSVGSGGTGSGGNHTNGSGSSGAAGNTTVYSTANWADDGYPGVTQGGNGGNPSGVISGGRTGGKGEGLKVMPTSQYGYWYYYSSIAAGAAQAGFARVYRGNTNIVV